MLKGLALAAVLVTVLLTARLTAVVTPPQSAAVFRSGSRLVEVEVVVREKKGPGPLPFGPAGAVIHGLTKDDFELFDEGHAQPVSLFRTGAGDASPVSLPAGAVSNRLDPAGQPIRSATAVLADFLNNPFDDTGYVRLGVTRLLASISPSDTRLAVYSLGESLHVLQDFTGDPQKLMDLAANLDLPRRRQPRELASALGDYGDLLDLGREQVHREMTVKALRLIIQHLSGVPGRKNLVWLMPAFYTPPAAILGMAQQAGVVLYPVLVRSVYYEVPSGALEREHAAEALAATFGGRAFFDAMDFPSAVRDAEEDSNGAYVLGFYPYENQLDGKFHHLVVKLKNPKLAGSYEIRYRIGYLATKVALPPPAPSPQELFEGPMDSTGIGVSAQASPDAAHPGLFDLTVMVDLHDVHLESKDGHFIGAVDLSVPNPSAPHTVKTATVHIDLTQDQLTAALASGLSGTVNAVEPQAGEIRVAVRDHSTGLAGSVRVVVAK